MHKKEHRFVPIYATTKGKPGPKEMPLAKQKPVMECVAQSQALATATIETILVPKPMLAALQS